MKIVWLTISFILCVSSAMAADGISWGRFWFRPQLGLYERYSDNIYLDKDDTQEDYITTLAPDLEGRFAFTPESNLELNYSGRFTHHTNFDNFGNYNAGSLKWSLLSATGSSIALGGKVTDTAVQPYSETDEDKPYLIKNAFADTNLNIGSFTGFGLRYDYTEREFDNDSDEVDNFNRNAIRTDFVYRYFTRFPILLEYRYAINEKENNPETNSRLNAVYAGARWSPATRLSGSLRIGYQYTDYDDIDDVSIIAIDTSLAYKLSEFTNLRLDVERTLKDSIRVDVRETGNNYIFTSVGGFMTYRVADPLTLNLELTYENKDFEREEKREDNLYRARVGLGYSINRWVALSVAYRYRVNMSTEESVEYIENTVYGGVRFSL